MELEIKELQERLTKAEGQLEQEIRKRRAAEESLSKSKETLKSVLREMPVIILAIDDDGYLVFYNKEFERVSGYSASEIRHNPQVFELLIPDNSDDATLDTAGQREWKFLSNDGTEKTIAWSNISGYFPILGWKSWKVGLDITELKQTIARVNTLGGLLPICANCKKIRDDKGYWNRLEGYIQDHSEAEFTHGICPECIEKLYPEIQD
ncbi:PAS [Olavius sp. associated proteobacterium Delta 1]|nr:PAS [Olavius sp. associated proteobacterium Delta 1]